jgi:GxxExxY protein
MDLNDLIPMAIGCAIKVHKALGPGLLESAYQECLCYEMRRSGLSVEKEKALPLVYEEVKLECGYRVDLMVEGKLVIEVKSVEALNDVHLAQVITYLRLSKCRIGLLINFNVVLLKHGIRRVIVG